MRTFSTYKFKLQHLFLAFILILTFLSYSTVLKNGFVNWDDNVYITSNALLNDLNSEKIVHIFSSGFEGHYHPMTLITLAIDKLVFGLNPAGFHAHNLIIHLLNIVLLFLFLQNLILFYKRSLHKQDQGIKKPNEDSLNHLKFLPVFVSAIFALHPMNVEAVAWATARKDVLYTFWFLVSLLFYLKSFDSKKYYYFSILAFTMSVLAKGQAFILPFCLILIDFLVNRFQFRLKYFLNKAPFLIIGIAAAIIAVIVQQKSGYTMRDGGEMSIGERVVFPALSLMLYLWKIILPVNLSAFYPYPETEGGTIPAYLWAFLLPASCFLLLMLYLIKRNRLAGFGLIFFMLNIFMFLKWIPVSNYIIADRYVYLGIAGLGLTAGWGLLELSRKKAGVRTLVYGLMILMVPVAAYGSYQRCLVWHDSLSLLNDILEKDPDVYTALNSRGDEYASTGDTASAMKDFSRAIEVRPQFGRAYANRGTLIARSGDCARAMADFDKALTLDPFQAAAYTNRARCLNLSGNFHEALEDLSKSADLGFDHPMRYYETGIAYFNLKDFNKAILEFNKVEQIKSDYPALYKYRGYANFNSNDMKATIADLDKALIKDPSNAVSLAIRGVAKSKTGDKNGGCEDLHRAMELGLSQAAREIERYCK